MSRKECGLPDSPTTIKVNSNPFFTDFLWTWLGKLAKPTYPAVSWAGKAAFRSEVDDIIMAAEKMDSSVQRNKKMKKQLFKPRPIFCLFNFLPVEFGAIVTKFVQSLTKNRNN